MKLHDKRELFWRGSLKCESYLDSDNLSLHGIRLRNRTSNLQFEQNTSFESDILPSQDPVFLGAYSYMNEGGYVRGPVFIGRFCSIGRRVSIGAGMHSISGLSSHPLLSTDRISAVYSDDQIQSLQLKLERSGGVRIGSDVWIGDGVVILPGVTIGDGSVIGANSVINKDVEPYTIVVGSQAKILRKRFPEYICSQLLELAWWEFNLETIKALDYRNIFNFLRKEIHLENLRNYSTYALAGEF